MKTLISLSLLALLLCSTDALACGGKERSGRLRGLFSRRAPRESRVESYSSTSVTVIRYSTMQGGCSAGSCAPATAPAKPAKPATKGW